MFRPPFFPLKTLPTNAWRYIYCHKSLSAAAFFFFAYAEQLFCVW